MTTRRALLIGAAGTLAGPSAIALAQGLDVLPGSTLSSGDPFAQQDLPLHHLDGPAAGGGRHGSGFWQAERTIWLRRPASKEELRATYWSNGSLVGPEYDRVCIFMRDLSMQRRLDGYARAGRAMPRGHYAIIGMSPSVLDVLYAVGAWLDYFGMSRPLILNSAFRHPLTNATTEGAARNSLHQVGAACDIVVPDVSSTQVGRFAAWLRAGGVGFYAGRGFTHVDAGRVRSWRG